MIESNCSLCLETITDPVCIKCYLRQVKHWFNDLNIDAIFKKFAVEKIKQRLNFETLNETNCILCRKENVNVCFFCFAFITVEILRELNIPDSLIENFSETFNYDFIGL